MTTLCIRSCSKRYPGASRLAVSQVSLDVLPGESMVLIGESGSGKTTLLRMIAGFELPSEGAISWGEQVLVDEGNFVQPEHRRTGMLFQDYALFPHLTVLENVMFGLHHLSKSRRRELAYKTLERVQLMGYEQRFPHMLSGGQQQRVALARALAPEPRLLLLDEPFSNLDSLVKEEVRDSIFEVIRETGISTVSVMHDMEDAMFVADRLALLKDGALQQLDTPQVLYDMPRNTYVARFLGKANLLDAVAVEGGLRTSFGTIARVHSHSLGSRRKLSLRPECLRLAGPSENGLCGVVQRVGFVGRGQEITVMSEDKDAMLLYVDRAHNIQVGEPLYFEVKEGKLHHLEPETDSEPE